MDWHVKHEKQSMTTLTENDISTIGREIHRCCNAAAVPMWSGAAVADVQLQPIVATVNLRVIASILSQINDHSD